MEKIENKKYNKLLRVGKTFNNYTFDNCTFESVGCYQCIFIGCDFPRCSIKTSSFINCVFINCDFAYCDFAYGSIDISNFISCSFSSCKFGNFMVLGNELLKCQCNKLEFTNNTQVTNNIFDGLTGNIESCDCVGAFNNTFKNMDFSGFINFYYQCMELVSSSSQVDWVRNKFINTTVSVDAIMELAKKAEVLGYPHHTRKGFISFDGLSIMIDMRGLSDEARFVITANALLRLPNNEETNRVADIEKGTLSCDLHLTAEDNDSALTIVNEGRAIKPSAIKRIDVKIHYSGAPEDIIDFQNLVQIDGTEYEIDLDDSGIYVPKGKAMEKVIPNIKNGF